jgi:hypothetical protein
MEFPKHDSIEADIGSGGRDDPRVDPIAMGVKPRFGNGSAHRGGPPVSRVAGRAADARTASAPDGRADPGMPRTPQLPAAPLAADRLLLTHPEFEVHLADTVFARRQAAALVARMYETRGYRWELGEELPSAPHQLTFVVRGEGGPVGTLTLRFDSELGLMADEHFGAEIDACRTRGGRACELVWFAFHPGEGSKALLANLFHLVYIYARMLSRATDMFIEVNPRHAGFYHRALGFRQVGAERTCQRVGAPAVLLCLDLAHADRQIARFAGRTDTAERTLYPYFLSALEHEALFRRILESA